MDIAMPVGQRIDSNINLYQNDVNEIQRIVSNLNINELDELARCQRLPSPASTAVLYRAQWEGRAYSEFIQRSEASVVFWSCSAVDIC